MYTDCLVWLDFNNECTATIEEVIEEETEEELKKGESEKFKKVSVEEMKNQIQLPVS